ISEQYSDESLLSLAELIDMPLTNCCSFVLTVPHSDQMDSSVEDQLLSYLEKEIDQPLHVIMSNTINDHIACFVSFNEEPMQNESSQQGLDQQKCDQQKSDHQKFITNIHSLCAKLQQKLSES